MELKINIVVQVINPQNNNRVKDSDYPIRRSESHLTVTRLERRRRKRTETPRLFDGDNLTQDRSPRSFVDRILKVDSRLLSNFTIPSRLNVSGKALDSLIPCPCYGRSSQSQATLP